MPSNVWVCVSKLEMGKGGGETSFVCDNSDVQKAVAYFQAAFNCISHWQMPWIGCKADEAHKQRHGSKGEGSRQLFASLFSFNELKLKPRRAGQRGCQGGGSEVESQPCKSFKAKTANWHVCAVCRLSLCRVVYPSFPPLLFFLCFPSSIHFQSIHSSSEQSVV